MRRTAVTLLALGLAGHALARPSPARPGGYAELVALFAEWRQAQKPRVVAGKLTRRLRFARSSDS